MDAWRAMISAQGGDPDAELPEAKETHTVEAPADGVLTQLDAYLDGLGLPTGVLVIFDCRTTADDIETRTRFETATTPGGRPITLLRA